mgnify:CR=1 FL=1
MDAIEHRKQTMLMYLKGVIAVGISKSLNCSLPRVYI